MKFTERLRAVAAADPKRIVFPEATEEKILQAARQVTDLGIAHPVLLGKEEEIQAAAAAAGVELSGMEVVDYQAEAERQKLITAYLEISGLYSEKALNRKFRNPLSFGAAYVKAGRADALAAGLVNTTGEVILAAQMFIGMKEGIETVSSIGIVEFPDYDGPEGNFLAIADCAVNPAPASEELADIALASADTVAALLGWEPRIAMLSFSTQGSSAHEDVDKVAAAAGIAREKRPELLIDGEFQLDAAIIPAVAAKKVKRESPVAGRANVLIFPDLGAGNIGVKLLQIFARAIAHGPLLQGFSRPVTDFSRSAPVEEIVGNLTMLVVQAQEKEAE